MPRHHPERRVPIAVLIVMVLFMNGQHRHQPASLAPATTPPAGFTVSLDIARDTGVHFSTAIQLPRLFGND